MSQQRSPQFGSSSSFLPKIIQQCPLCTKDYAHTDMNIVGEGEGTQLIHITCPSCKHAIVALVVLSQLGVSSIGMLTDLNAQEMSRLMTTMAISQDDVLTFHDALLEHQQDFIYLLSKQTV